MTFDEAIYKIMPEVGSGSEEPFIVYRGDNGNWNCDFTQNQYGDTFGWVEGVKEQDPFALTFKGSDFAGGSFPYVYDKILTSRLRAEYNKIQFGEANLGEYQALLCFCEENIGGFSSEITDYLTMYDKPLAALYDMLPISLKSIDNDYDASKTEEVFELIERRFSEIRSRNNEEIKTGYSGIRDIDGYKEKICIKLAGKQVVLAENQSCRDPYLICNIKYDNLLGIEERYNGVVTDNYVEAMREFVNHVDDLVVQLEAERQESGLPFQTLSYAEHCIANSNTSDYENKMVVIKPEILAPEYRSAEHQLAIVTDGFGANPEARGRAVFVKELYSGENKRYDRIHIAGIADLSKIPEWAKKKIAELHTQKAMQSLKGTVKKTSLLERIEDAKLKANKAPENSNRKTTQKKRDGQEV